MLENYTNLSPVFLITSLIASSAALGIGLVIAYRLLPQLKRVGGSKVTGQLATDIRASSPADDKHLRHGQGRLRKSEILFITK